MSGAMLCVTSPQVWLGGVHATLDRTRTRQRGQHPRGHQAARARIQPRRLRAVYLQHCTGARSQCSNCLLCKHPVVPRSTRRGSLVCREHVSPAGALLLVGNGGGTL